MSAPQPLDSPVAVSGLPIARTRAALLLMSLAAVALELVLMRGLALRFWSHFAGMVISVGLLGFGAAGSMLTLFRGRVMRHQRAWLAVLGLAFSPAVLVAWWGSQTVDLDVQFLAWSFSQAKYVLLIELLMSLPFLVVGAFVGVALMDLAPRITGHYAADLIGSGSGGIVAVLAMHFLGTVELIVAISGVGFVAAALVVPWRSRPLALAAMGSLAVLAMGAAMMPWEPAVSPYKLLAQARNWKDTTEIYRAEGPLGQINVLAGPRLHYAPGLSLQYGKEPPPQVLMITDGDGISPVYDCPRLKDWEFLDYRTAAAVFHCGSETPPRVAIIGAGGGAEIGMALYQRAASITALEINPQVISAMEGPLAARGGVVYSAPGVRIVNQEARGFFAATTEKFDIVQLPPIDGFGASGSGLYATQESYLYTVESMQGMLEHLSPGGVLSVTRWVRNPPREELRAFDMLAEALRAKGLDPVPRLFMLRNWITCTILASNEPFASAQLAALQEFCRKRAFDLCYAPPEGALSEKEANRNHTVQHAFYFKGPRALLGPEREQFLASYRFDIAAPTDDKPYFFHSFRWQAMAAMKEEMGAGSNAFLEMGYIMLVVALVQAGILGLVMVMSPLLPGVRALRRTPGKFMALGYFLMLGLGFMLLEMVFVQNLVLYLAHPIYAAAVVIGAFLLFAGLGSAQAGRWKGDARRVITLAAGVVVVFSVVYLAGLDRWLQLTQSWPVAARCVVATLTISPLAFAMGHLLPLGLQRLAKGSPELVPWCWAVNGFASVVATAAAPLFAMQFGFSRLVLVAMGCYVVAGMLCWGLHARERHAAGPAADFTD